MASGPESTAAQRLRETVSFLTETVGPRDPGHLSHLQKVSAYLYRSLASFAREVEIQPFIIAGVTYENVIARFGPPHGDPVIIGAHYDSVSDSSGADDNASGVAGLLELARRLKDIKLPAPVELAAYSLEESEFATENMGSVRHAQRFMNAKTRVRAMLCLEMIGYFSDQEGSQSAPDPRIAERYPSKGNFLMVVGRIEDMKLTTYLEETMRAASPLPIHSINAPRAVPGIDLSDHRNFWDAGFPAAMITDTAFYRNPNYHKPTDTIETLDFNRMAMAVDAVMAGVVGLASQSENLSR